MYRNAQLTVEEEECNEMVHMKDQPFDLVENGNGKMCKTDVGLVEMIMSWCTGMVSPFAELKIVMYTVACLSRLK